MSIEQTIHPTSDNGNNQNDNATISTVPPRALSPLLIRIIFLLLGVGILIPWNAFVSAKPYFQARFCESGDVIVNFELWFGVVWNTSSVISLGLVIFSVALRDYLTQSHLNDPSEHDPMLLDSTTDETLGGRNSNLENSSSNGDSIGSKSQNNSFWLVMVPLGLYMGVFLITDFLVLFQDIAPKTFLILTLSGLAVCGTCGAIATAGIVSTAGLFESHLGITPFFSGQALGGVLVSMANFLSASLESPEPFYEQKCTDANNTTSEFQVPTDNEVLTEYRHNRILNMREKDEQTCLPYSNLDWAVFGYFFVGCLVLACCLAGYTVVDKYQQQEHRDDYEAVQDAPQHFEHTTQLDQIEDQSPRIGLQMNECTKERRAFNASHFSTEEHQVVDAREQDSLQVSQPEDQHNSTASELVASLEEYTDEESEISVCLAIKGPAVCTFLVFTVTLCLFPGWISQLRSSHMCQSGNRLDNDLYVPRTFVIFNVGDLMGRLLSEKVPVQQIRNFSSKLVAAAVCRLIFFPLLLMCVSEEDHHASLLPSINSDIYSTIIQFLFAFTNGLLVSCSFMHAPTLVTHSMRMQERASEIMTFAVYFGLLSGSLLSFPFSQLTHV